MIFDHQRPTVTKMVATYITEKIISGELPGGQPIRQEAIAKELGVSRVPIREALLQLEADGLVQIQTHRGAVVSSLSREDAIDVFDTREILELFLIQKAVGAATQRDYDAIQAVLDRYDMAIRQGGEPAQLSQINWDFHIALLEPSQRPRSLSVLRMLYISLDRYLQLQIQPKEAQRAAVKDHRAMFEAYTRRDTREVTRFLKTHMALAYEEVLTRLEAAADCPPETSGMTDAQDRDR